MNPGLLAFLGMQGIVGSGQQQMNQAMAGQPGQPTNWGAVGGGIGGMGLGALAGGLAGRGLSNWAARQAYTAGGKELPKELTKDLKKSITAEGRTWAKTAGKGGNIFAKGTNTAKAVEGAAAKEGLIAKTMGAGGGLLGKSKTMLAANPEMATVLGALAGASLIGGMSARKGGAQADQQYAAKMQSLQAMDAQQQQENLNTLSKLPQIRF